MGALVWAIVITSAVWVYVDARKIGVRKGLVAGFGNLGGPVLWAFCVLMLWIVAFPAYLAYRNKFKEALARDGGLPPDAP